MKERLLVTGGAGFIGSEFVRQAVSRGFDVVVVDKLTYAGDLERLSDVNGRYRFYKIDTASIEEVQKVFDSENPDIVVHFAAESHVDRSLFEPYAFIR
jgi:dTDP-glucose 4,6-dehydratase (EC 4.2.1.46)